MVVNSKFKIPTALELFKNLKNVQSEWKFKTPLQKWCYLYGIGRAAYTLIRAPIFNNVNRVHWFGYCAVTYMSVIPMLSLYTVCYYALNGNMRMALPSTCIASLFIGVSNSIYNQFKLYSIRSAILRVIYILSAFANGCSHCFQKSI